MRPWLSTAIAGEVRGGRWAGLPRLTGVFHSWLGVARFWSIYSTPGAEVGCATTATRPSRVRPAAITSKLWLFSTAIQSASHGPLGLVCALETSRPLLPL